jgi:hypothetical protein
MPGLVVTAPGNQKTMGRIQRAFVVYARNATDQDRSYYLTVPATPGAFASFKPINEALLPAPALTSTIGPIMIPRRSSIARSVFVVAPGQEYPAITVQVEEAVAIGQTGAMAAVVLNPDIANPDIANPDIANPDIANPDIANAEVYNPDIANVTVSNPDIANPDIANPDIANPDIANPDIANTTVANPDIANPDIANPDIANPDIANPDIANPDIANPDIANSAISNFNVTDVTWSVKNTGNTTAAYAFRARLARTLPEGAKLQLIVRRVYIAPQANFANTCGPLQPAIQNQVLVNIPNPDLASDLFSTFDPQAYADNASFFLAPSDEGRVTLRVFCPTGTPGCPTTADAARSFVAARVEAQAPNNCPAGAVNPVTGLPYANCAVNGFQPDDIYDTTAPTTACSVTGDGQTFDCAAGPFYFKTPAIVTLAPADSVGVQQTLCSVNGTACGGLTFATPATAGAYTVSFQSRDYSGNLEALRSLVITIDTTAPVVSGFSFPGATVEGQWVSAPSVTGTINVNEPVTVVCGDSLGRTQVDGLRIIVSGDGSHVLSCTVTDQAGNTVQAGTTINLDTVAPTVTAPTTGLVTEATGFGTIVEYGVSAADALSGYTVSCTPPSGSSFGVGDTLVTCEVTDGAGNTATARFTITVLDVTPPVVTLNGAAAVTLEAGSAFTDPGASALDLVDGAIAVVTTGAVQTTVPGAYTLTYTATDAKGNVGQASRLVTVVDTTAPVVTLNGAAAISIEAGAAFTDPGATAVDAADGAVAAVATGTVNAAVPGTYMLTYTATDATGNAGTATRVVTVVDTTAPVVTLSGAPAVTIEAGSAFTDPGATALDTVNGPLTVSVSGSVQTMVPGTYTLTYTATDAEGNVGQASLLVTVVDTTAPVVTLNGAAAVTIEAGTAFTDPGASALDLVDGAVAVVVTGAVQTTVPGAYTLTYTATDRAGNRASASRTVTVRDTVAPTFTMAVNPTKIWSPNGAMVPVTVSGVVTERGSGVGSATYSVKDEYNTVQPTGPITVAADGSYSVPVLLQASRKGADKNGRTYTITVTVTDRSGLSTSVAITIVAVEHNQS